MIEDNYDYLDEGNDIYALGLVDGYNKAKAEIVRCKDCYWWTKTKSISTRPVCLNANVSYW